MTEHLRLLWDNAKATVERMSPDDLAHMHHAQRLSFAFSNVALSRGEMSPDELAQLRTVMVKAAGPCLCAPCRNRASGLRGIVTAYNTQDDRTGYERVGSGCTVSGEITGR